MRSPLEILSGRFDHALLTTYSFNLRFFESWVLRALWAAEVRNVILFVDELQLGNALIDNAPSVAGRAYHLVSARNSKGAFHPKVILVTGDEGSRLCVSSANLTADGQMRNAESAIAFDSEFDGHQQPIRDAGEFFRALGKGAPSHTAAAIETAVKNLPAGDTDASFRFLHNMNGPLIDSFPDGRSVTAVTPFVDARGTAAKAVHEKASLKVIVDGERIAAGPEFFSSGWDVEARRFRSRLHGKAYDVDSSDGRWLLVGSPNLTAPALLRSAADGNLEVAVTIKDGEPLALPESSPWEGADLAIAAAERLSAENENRDSAEEQFRSFDAWADGNALALAGLPDGALVERLEGDLWIEIGRVTDGTVELPGSEIRPSRLRATAPDGSVWFAVVAWPARLRARAQAATRGRQSEAAERLPIDLEMARVLEETLSDFYALSGPVDSIGAAPRDPESSSEASQDEEAKTLLQWMPRSLDEEPRVPPLYQENWKGEPDALLALISRSLRLEKEATPAEENELAYENLSLDELDETVGGEIEAEPQVSMIEFSSRQLSRYRREFQRLFERGLNAVSSAEDPVIAGGSFNYLFRLVEDLGSTTVKVGAAEQHLMDRGFLRGLSLDLLVAYWKRKESDPLCLATARAHLAAAIRERPRLKPLDAERMDSLAYAWAPALLAAPEDAPGPPTEKVGLDPGTVNLLLRDYAGRSLWAEIAKEGADRLADGRLESDPWPVLVGGADIEERLKSPVWSLLAYISPAGYSSMQQFGVVVFDSAASPLTAHILVCIPDKKLLVEGFRRRSDDVWVERVYSGVSSKLVEGLRNPTELNGMTEGTREFEDMGDSSSLLRPLSSILDSRHLH